MFWCWSCGARCQAHAQILVLTRCSLWARLTLGPKHDTSPDFKAISPDYDNVSLAQKSAERHTQEKKTREHPPHHTITIKFEKLAEAGRGAQLTARTPVYAKMRYLGSANVLGGNAIWTREEHGRPRAVRWCSTMLATTAESSSMSHSFGPASTGCVVRADQFARVMPGPRVVRHEREHGKRRVG